MLKDHSSLIINNLYIGDAHTANDLQEMRKLGITHVLNLAAESPP